MASSTQMIGARLPPRNRSVAQPDQYAPAIPPNGNTAYLKAAVLTLSRNTSFRCVTPQSVKPYRHASSKHSAIATSHRAGLASVSAILVRKDRAVEPRPSAIAASSAATGGDRGPKSAAGASLR